MVTRTVPDTDRQVATLRDLTRRVQAEVLGNAGTQRYDATSPAIAGHRSRNVRGRDSDAGRPQIPQTYGPGRVRSVLSRRSVTDTTAWRVRALLCTIG